MSERGAEASMGDAAGVEGDGRGDDAPLLAVEDLVKHYPVTTQVLEREIGRVRAVDGISFTVDRGETFGLVGESGCGKSTAAETLLRIEEPTDGTVRFDGDDVTAFDREETRAFRRHAQMIFQDPTTSFDPRMTIGESVAEPLRAQGVTADARGEVVEGLLDRVGLTAADADRYPHELSGGQKQRAALARALSVNPDLLVADEPVSALDVSVQAEILSLLEDIQSAFDLAVVFISHDMSVVGSICDRIGVMYLGEIVERGPTDEVLEAPQHPYAEALVASVPTPDPRKERGDVGLTGEVPDASDPPPGCRFHTRCPDVIQPDGYDLDQEAWRAVMDLRVDLRDDQLDVETIRETFVDGGLATDLAEAVRKEYGLPPELRDGGAESVLADALAVIDEDEQAAADRLADPFETVCERSRPELQDTEAGHPAACHLHDAADGDD